MKAFGWIRGRQVELDLVLIGKDTHGRDMYLHRPAAHDYLAMEKHAAADGLRFILNRSWASMLDQQILHDQYKTDLTRHQERVAAGVQSKAPAFVQEPGRSPHQAGCSIDQNRAHDHGKTDLWLEGNAKTYGFIADAPGEAWHRTHMETYLALLKQLGLR